MKQIRQILWEKDLFILFLFYFIFYFFLFFVIFPRLRDKSTFFVHFFWNVQISCIIIDINPIEKKKKI